MTDVFEPVLIPYTRFLEVRARRRRIVTELTQSNPEGPIPLAASSAPTLSEQRAGAAVRTVAPTATDGIQR